MKSKLVEQTSENKLFNPPLRQCDDLPTHIALPTSEPDYYVHVQLVSLLQWRVPNRPLQLASRLVSLLQWHDPNRPLR